MRETFLLWPYVCMLCYVFQIRRIGCLPKKSTLSSDEKFAGDRQASGLPSKQKLTHTFVLISTFRCEHFKYNIAFNEEIALTQQKRAEVTIQK